MTALSLEQWLKDGRRFTEEEALLIALEAVSRLDFPKGSVHQAHVPFRLATTLWSPVDRRATFVVDTFFVVDAFRPCAGFEEDCREIGAALVTLLGGTTPFEKLPLSPPFRAVLEGMLAVSKRGYASPAALRRELAGALGGVMPRRLFWGSRRVQAWVVAVVCSCVLAASLYRSLTGPNRVLTLKGQPDQAAFSPDGKYFAASMDRSVHVWDTATWHRRLYQAPPLPGSGYQGRSVLAFSADSTRLLLGRPGILQEGTLFEWNLENSESFTVRAKLRGTPAWIAPSPDGTRIALASYLPTERDQAPKSELVVLDAKSGAVLAQWSVLNHNYTWVAWRPDNRRLFYRAHEWVAGKYQTTSLFDQDANLLGEKRRIVTDAFDGADAAAMSPDGARFVTADRGYEAFRLIDFAGHEERRLNSEVYNRDYSYRAFSPGAFSPDGRRFACALTVGGKGASRRVRIWDAQSWRLKRERKVRSWRLKNPVIGHLAMSRRWLAAVYGNSFDTEIHLWDIAR